MPRDQATRQVAPRQGIASTSHCPVGARQSTSIKSNTCYVMRAVGGGGEHICAYLLLTNFCYVTREILQQVSSTY